MRNKKIMLLIALAIMLSPPVSLTQTVAKKKTASAAASGASSGIEPLRVINGEMLGRTVTGQFKQGAKASAFSFTITKAEVVNGRLQLTGDLAIGARAKSSDQVTATIAGTMAKAENPWPSARDS